MKFVLAFYGIRGDIEPGMAVGHELQRRGHEVQMAVPPAMVDFVESTGLSAVAYGLDTQAILELALSFWKDFQRNFWKIPGLLRLWHQAWELVIRCWAEMKTPLMSLADGADLLFTSLGFEQPAANVAEYYDIPLATLHWMPARPNGHLVPIVPAPLLRSVMTIYDWVYWLLTKKAEDTQRRELGLPKAMGPSGRRITRRGSLEIQAYDEVCFPGLAAEWAKFNGQRPFVGTLTMEMPTEADDQVLSWIAAGTPPIFFGFGSMPVKSPADALAMISTACAQLGERALVCAGFSDFSDIPSFDNAKVVSAVNYAAVFPACRAVVHHGGAGTTAAGLRAGVPTLILWMDAIQSVWGAQLKRLKAGFGRRFSSTTQKSLVADLRRILAPEYIAGARELATQMTKPAESVAAAADHLERYARRRRVG